METTQEQRGAAGLCGRAGQPCPRYQQRVMGAVGMGTAGGPSPSILLRLIKPQRWTPL